MLFSLDQDSGATIEAYLVPDSGGAVPSVLIRAEGIELRMRANKIRPELIVAGRHATGRCGFVIDGDTLADLAECQNLEIVEAESGLIIYRRPRHGFIRDMKVFRLETHLKPLWRIDDALNDKFQYWYKGVDRLGFETSTQVFCIAGNNSTFVSGRLFIKNIESYLSRGFKAVALFRDPYQELAERLLILKTMTAETATLLGPRDAMTFEPMMSHLAALDRFDEASCKRLFKRASASLTAPLANPLVRQLTAAAPDEPAKKGAIAAALAALATFEVIGLRSDAEPFTDALADVLGLERGTMPAVEEDARVVELGRRLRSIREVGLLLELDLELFAHTTEAFRSVGS